MKFNTKIIVMENIEKNHTSNRYSAYTKKQALYAFSGS